MPETEAAPVVVVSRGIAVPIDPIPENPFIGRGDETEPLYAAETRLGAAVEVVAEQLSAVRGFPAAQFYSHAVPAALLSTLDHFSPRHAAPAAIAYLRGLGCTVTLPTPPTPEGAPDV